MVALTHWVFPLFLKRTTDVMKLDELLRELLMFVWVVSRLAGDSQFPTYAFRSSEVRRLLLDLVPNDGTDPLGVSSFS